jgi:hypothetical protein
MADSADPRSIAAHLAAALIASKPLEKAKGGPAAAAAKIYFDVLDAVKKEQDKRYTPPTVQQERQRAARLEPLAQRSVEPRAPGARAPLPPSRE